VKPAGASAPAGPTQRARTSPRGAGDPHADIAWINEILWGVSADATIGRTGEADESTTVATFVALPSARHPHLLVPAASHPAARRALRSYTDPRRRVRVATALLAAGAHVRLPELLGERVRVSLAREQAAGKASRPALSQYIAEVLDRHDLEVAVRLGAPRPNRKPVLQVLASSGEVLAYAKVGWNALTRSLVRNEAAVLTTLADEAKRPFSFSVPTVIHAGQCGDLDVLVLAPVSRLPWLVTTPSRRQLVAALLELASLTPRSREALAVSTWWRSTRARLDALEALVRESRFEVLQDFVTILEERYGDAELDFGRSHGDWTCWNIGRRNGRLTVLDWERSHPLVPVGLDAAHYDFDAAVKLAKRPPLEVVAQLLSGRGTLLPALAPDLRRARLLVALDLLDMVLRFEEARSEGLDILDTVYFGALRSAVLSAGDARVRRSLRRD
jgi:hypothetical protein